MAKWRIGGTVYDDNLTPTDEEVPESATIPRGFIKLTMNDDRPIAIRVDMIESFFKGINAAKGHTVIVASGCPNDNGSYWVKETPSEICALINNTRR